MTMKSSSRFPLTFPGTIRSILQRYRHPCVLELKAFLEALASVLRMWLGTSDLFMGTYPLVNIQITMENHHFQWERPLFQWAIFNSYFDITRGYGKKNDQTCDGLDCYYQILSNTFFVLKHETMRFKQYQTIWHMCFSVTIKDSGFEDHTIVEFWSRCRVHHYHWNITIWWNNHYFQPSLPIIHYHNIP